MATQTLTAIIIHFLHTNKDQYAYHGPFCLLYEEEQQVEVLGKSCYFCKRDKVMDEVGKSKVPPNTMKDKFASSSSAMKSSGKEKASSSSKMSREEMLQVERNRREKMTEFYTTLQSLVPGLFPKATRTKIIDQTIDFIKSLEEYIIELDSQKIAKELQARRSSTASVTVSGKTAFFGLCFLSRPGLITRIIEVFERHKAEILATTVARDEGYVNVTVTALLCEEEDVERIKAELMAI